MYLLEPSSAPNPSEGWDNTILEYFPGGMNLKSYAIEHYAAPTDPSLKWQCQGLGRGLGRWLHSFHDWSVLPEQSQFRDVLAGNGSYQELKNSVNYGAVVRLVDKFPSILSEFKMIFEEVFEMTKGELLDSSQLRPLHGDFWTGKQVLP
jgi:hypothetical protein